MEYNYRRYGHGSSWYRHMMTNVIVFFFATLAAVDASSEAFVACVASMIIFAAIAIYLDVMSV